MSGSAAIRSAEGERLTVVQNRSGRRMFDGRVPRWLIGRSFVPAVIALVAILAAIVVLLLRYGPPGNV